MQKKVKLSGNIWGTIYDWEFCQYANTIWFRLFIIKQETKLNIFFLILMIYIK